MRNAFWLGALLAIGAINLTAHDGHDDTDGDGYSDDIELAAGSNPSDPLSKPFNGQFDGPPVAFDRAMASVRLRLTDPNGPGVVRLNGSIPLPQAFDFTGRTMLIAIGGVVRTFTLDPTGFGINRDDVISFVPGAETAGRFALSFRVKNIIGILGDRGITNTTAKGAPVSLPVTVLLAGRRFAVDLFGFYNAKAGLSGEATFSSTASVKPVRLPITRTRNFDFSPKPALPQQPVTFTAETETGDPEGILGTIFVFGDGSPPERTPGFAFASGKTVTHTYAREGSYAARLITLGPDGISLTRLFVAVGLRTSVNSAAGIATTQTNAGNVVTLQINVDEVENATKVVTDFVDTPAPTPPAASRESQEGTIPTRTYTSSGISVATTTVTDDTGATVATGRKQVTVDEGDVGSSEALPEPASTEIVLSKMSGKFLFSADDKPDKVSFTGTVILPTGFQPAREGGNSFVFGIGNIVDSIVLDSKGKPLDRQKSSAGYITSIKMKYPKLAKGTTATVGGETATLTVKLSLPNMDTTGFDSEGITAELREDEQDLEEVERYIQVSMLLGGVGYESVVTVTYKVTSSSSNSTGTITGRAATQ